MSIKFEIFPDLRIVQTVISGTVQDKMCIDNARSLADKPGFDASFDQIIDLTGVTSNQLTEAGLKEISEITPFSSSSRRAFIIAENNMVTRADYFSSLYKINSENIFVTNSREKAYSWLLG